MKRMKLPQGVYALLDDEDFERLGHYNWQFVVFKKGASAVTRSEMVKGKRTTYYLHREIMNCPKDMVVDHADHDTLNNQKSNLRICTRSQNQMNLSLRKDSPTGYKGVKISKKSGRFFATLTCKGKVFWLGTYDDPKRAAAAYNEKAKELFGEFAYLNPLD